MSIRSGYVRTAVVFVTVYKQRKCFSFDFQTETFVVDARDSLLHVGFAPIKNATTSMA